jgi:hypothetical protein
LYAASHVGRAQHRIDLTKDRLCYSSVDIYTIVSDVSAGLSRVLPLNADMTLNETQPLFQTGRSADGWARSSTLRLPDQGEQDKDVAYRWPLPLPVDTGTDTMVPSLSRAENHLTEGPVGWTSIDILNENLDAVLMDRLIISGHNLLRRAHCSNPNDVSTKNRLYHNAGFGATTTSILFCQLATVF